MFNEEVRANIWKFYDMNYYIVIPTNGAVNQFGDAVMGRGLARQAKIRFAALPGALGQRLREEGNQVYAWTAFRMFTFPVKEHWKDTASLDLIRRSAGQLKAKAEFLKKFPIYIPRVGCGNGRLNWDDVKPVLAEVLDERFIVAWEPEVEGVALPNIRPIA